MQEWNTGMILTGFEKPYIIDGPELSGLYNAQVIRLELQGVPTSYNADVNVLNMPKNFEWYFECKKM